MPHYDFTTIAVLCACRCTDSCMKCSHLVKFHCSYPCVITFHHSDIPSFSTIYMYTVGCVDVL